MLQLTLWIIVCLVAAFALRRQPQLLIIGSLVLIFLVPAVAGAVVTGQSSGSLSFHPATWLILFTFLIQWTHQPGALLAALHRHPYLLLLLVLVLAAGVLTTKVDGGSGLVVLIDQILAPVVLFVTILARAPQDPRLVRTLVVTLLALSSVVALLAVIQWSTRSVLFYREYFSTQYWFTDKLDRWMGTLDQPLALSLVLCVMGALLATVRQRLLSLLLLALFAAGVLTTQSRVGVVVFAVVVLFVVLTSELRPAGKVLTLAVVIVGGYFLVSSPLMAGVLGRFADDTGSTAARGSATDFFLSSWSSFVVAGRGMTASYEVGQQAGLGTSLENAFLMYSVDLGMLFALLYFGSMVVILLRAAAARVTPGLLLAGLLTIVLPQTYSSLATRSAAGVVVWTVLGLLVVATQAARQAQTSPPAPAHHSSAVRVAAPPPRPGPRTDRVPWST